MFCVGTISQFHTVSCVLSVVCMQQSVTVDIFSSLTKLNITTYNVSQKKIHPRGPDIFFIFFTNG